MYIEYNFGSEVQLPQILLNPSLISNKILRADVIKCCADDQLCSCEIELLKNCVGREYEEILYRKLRDHNICFETENEMRLKGKSKTPDALLLIPMLVKNERDEEYIINWIDSKAMFGETDLYTSEHLPQLRSYCNRCVLIY